MLGNVLTLLVLVYTTLGSKGEKVVKHLPNNNLKYFLDQFHNHAYFYEAKAPPAFSIEDLGATNLGPEEEKSTSFWINKAQDAIADKIKVAPLEGRAKNVIFFIGDGMSLATMTAARIYESQKNGNLWGEENVLSFEKLPYSGQVKTYCTNGQVADSACSATAYHTGVKTNIGAIGVNANVTFNDCSTSSNPENQVESIIKWAQDACKSTGIVTTTRVTHASLSPLYAHVAFRDWEGDTDLEKYGQDPSKCQDIASQLVNNSPGDKVNVIFGGGKGRFYPKEVHDEKGIPGLRGDGQNLIDKWRNKHPSGRFISSRQDLLEIQCQDDITHVLGLFEQSHLKYYADSDKSSQPSLTEMTEAAIKLLSKNDNGFYLFVEGGNIDTAHHENKLRQSLEETKEFARAVERALEMVDLSNTLVVVSADHSHSVGIAGYPKRGNDITGLVDPSFDSNNVPYAAMNYMFGPNQYRDENGQRLNLEAEFKEANMNFIYPSMTPSGDNFHAGDDVAIFAVGPYAHLFSGVQNQNVIPEILSFAACIGNGLTHCKLNGIPTESCDICNPLKDLEWRQVQGIPTDYKMCINGFWVTKKCPEGFQFNKDKGYCIKIV